MNGRGKRAKVLSDTGVTSSARRDCATSELARSLMSLADSHPSIVENVGSSQHPNQAPDAFDPLQNIRQYDDDDGDGENIHDEAEAEAEAEAEVESPTSICPPQRGMHRIARGPSGRFVSSKEASCSGDAGRGKRKYTEDDSWRISGPMPGGPEDASVIPSYGGHIAADIYADQERVVLMCHNRKSSLKKLQEWESQMTTNSPKALQNCQISNLLHLPQAMFKHLDMPLISAFVERWQPDTNSFHLPFGEMTILLHDVHHILRIPVDGMMVCTEQEHSNLMQSLAELLSVSPEDLVKPPVSMYQGGGVLTRSLIERCKSASLAPVFQGAGFLLALLGCTVFIDKSGSRVRPTPLPLLLEADSVSKYAWGAATLANLYRQLGRASRADTTQIAGCLTLLQAWIYEYFPVFRPSHSLKRIEEGWPRTLLWDVRNESKEFSRLLTIRRLIDDLQASQIDWLPYKVSPVESARRTLFMGNIRCFDIIEPYMPDRVVRQLGYIQSIPNPITIPDLARRPRDEKKYKVEFSVASTETAWRGFPRGYFLGVFGMDKAHDPGAVSADYYNWYATSSHPYVAPEHQAQSTEVSPSIVTSDHVLAGLINDMKEVMLCKDFDQIQPAQYRSGIKQAVARLKSWNLVRGVSQPHSSSSG